MATMKIKTSSGPVEVEGRRFSHYIGNVRFWFFYHRSTDHVAMQQVTHHASGIRVCFVSANTRIACLGDEIGAARLSLDKLAQEKGADIVRDALCRAEKRAAEPLEA